MTRSYALLENFSAAFSAICVIGGVRSVFYIGMSLGGPQAYWATFWISVPFILITGAVLAEVCSSLPAAGSIYLWAAASGGKRFSRLFGFLAAWWSTTCWTAFVASSCQAAANFMLSEPTVFGIDFDTDTNHVKFRVIQWIVSEGFLLICLVVNYFPSEWYKWVFRFSLFLILLDTLINIIWLPIGVHNSYGFRDSKFAFTEFYNISGLPDGWAWQCTMYATGGILIGFDASGHVAEETKNASHQAAKGLFASAVASLLNQLPLIIIFLYCTPDLDTLFSFDAPQPMVNFYALAVGNRSQIVLTVIAILSTWASAVTSIVAASRLVYAIARDGVLPFSGWISDVDKRTSQPKNAITFIGIVAGILLCSILPSAYAFQSLVSIAAVPTVAAWGLVSFGQFFFYNENKKHMMKPKFSLGVFSRPFKLISFLWNTYLCAIMLTPLEYPVTSQNFNYAPVVLGIISIFAIASYIFIPEDKWFQVNKHLQTVDSSDTTTSEKKD